MNPAEKVRAILDQLTGPLYKDDPFGTGGRKILFDGSCNELNNFSFQAFINRINTFKPEYWGSDPNAALYLAKYGFKSISECKVQCCCCDVAVEMQIFLGKPDVLLTLAKESHKQHCRWSRSSISKTYFAIPRDPYRSLQDMKNSVSEMTALGSNLPIVLKQNWIKMGFSEDFVMAVLNFLKFEYSDLLASCVVLSLCGWVKSSDTSLQCNFCRRVVGIWNFFNDNRPNSENSDRCPPIKRSRVISLLYSKIRHDMSSDEVEVIECNSEGGAEQNPVGVTELNSVASEVLSVEGTELNNEEVMEVNSVDMTELNSLRESEQLHCDPPSRSAWTHDSSSRSDDSVVDTCTVERIVDKAWDEYTYLRAQEIKKKALRFLWNKHKRSREPYFYKLQRLKLYRQEADEIEKLVDEDHRLVQESTSSENYTETEQYCDRKENSDVSYNSAGDHDEKIQSIVDSECNSYNYGASSDKNGFYSTEHDIREEYCTQSKSHTSSPGHETIVIDSSSEVKSSNNSYKSADDATEQSESDVESKCQLRVGVLNSNCVNSKESVVKVEKVNVTELSNECNMPSIQSNQSENSCDVASVSHDDSDGRRKRKRVPECERNGKPYDSEMLPRLPVQMEPAHFTRSKKKELEMMMNERTKTERPTSNVQQCHDSGHEIIELLSSEGEAASENETKTPPSQAEPEGNQVCSDIVNANTPNTRSSENNSLIMSNHEEDNTELTPVICSVVGNAVIPDTSEEEMDNEGVNYKEDEFSRGPIIVSAKSVCDEGMLQDYMEEEGRKFENGYRVKRHCYSDISEIDSSPEKSMCDTVTSKSYDASEDTSSTLEECPETCRCKRKRRESDEYTDRPSKVPNVEDTNDRHQVPNVEDSNDGHQVPNVEDTNDGHQVPNAQVTNCPLQVPNIEESNIELTPSYFHPELEHRYWCIWRIKTADHAQSSLLRMKGWEFYMDAIKQGLELQNAERVSVCQAESDALSRLADILAVARERNA